MPQYCRIYRYSDTKVSEIPSRHHQLLFELCTLSKLVGSPGTPCDESQELQKDLKSEGSLRNKTEEYPVCF